MNPSDISVGQLVLFMVLGLAIMVIAPFAKAGLLYVAIRVVKFRDIGYWRCFFCILIGFGATMAIEMVLMGISIQPGQEFDPEAMQGIALISSLLGLIVAPIAEFIALLLFFKESIGRSAGAIAVHWLFCVVAGIVLVLGLVGISMIVGLATG